MNESWRELEKRVRRVEIGVAVLLALGLAPIVGIDPKAPATAAANQIEHVVYGR